MNEVITLHKDGYSDDMISSITNINIYKIRETIKFYYDDMRSEIASEIMEHNHQADVIVCSHFGCGKHLTLIERLCGSRCIKHQLSIDQRT